MQHQRAILAFAVLLLVAAAGGFVLLEPATSVQAQREPAGLRGSGILDGMKFSGMAGPLGKPADVEDTLIFSEGTLVSTECETRCNYPRAPYFVRRRGDAVEFVSRMRCLDKDATIEWRGTVADGTIEGVFTWTLKHWYWTIEKKFRFEGTRVDRAAGVAG